MERKKLEKDKPDPEYCHYFMMGEVTMTKRIAWKLLQEGVDINVVQKVTGFSPEALATLAEPESATSLNPIYIPPQISQ
jgi:hypothetical protein